MEKRLAQAFFKENFAQVEALFRADHNGKGEGDRDQQQTTVRKKREVQTIYRTKVLKAKKKKRTSKKILNTRLGWDLGIGMWEYWDLIEIRLNRVLPIYIYIYIY